MVCSNHSNSDWGHSGQSVEIIDLLRCWKLHHQVLLPDLCNRFRFVLLYVSMVPFHCDGVAFITQVLYGLDTVCAIIKNSMLNMLLDLIRIPLAVKYRLFLQFFCYWRLSYDMSYHAGCFSVQGLYSQSHSGIISTLVVIAHDIKHHISFFR